MTREFLEQYSQSIDLDDKNYDRYFTPTVKRSDFLLFDQQVICEFKEFQTIDIKRKVEKISCKGDFSERDSKDNLYKRIERSLSDANKQISDTKKAFCFQDSLGLVILENLVENDLSTLSLIDAANRKMLKGLVHIDCVLCLDFVNTFSNSEGELIRCVQTVLRDTEKANRLYELLYQLMADFCDQSDTPLLREFEIEKGEQVWQTDEDGNYKAYKARLDFKPSVMEIKPGWKLRTTRFIARWWWVILVPSILYDWFVR